VIRHLDYSACMEPAQDTRRSVDDVARLRAEHPEARVLDVRSAADRAARPTIPGSELLDVNAQLADGDLEVLLEQGLSPDTPLVFVCNTGGKCGRAAAFLAERGFDAVSVDGGMRAWEAADQPVDPPVEGTH
jgi:rhodanese-related sulfurtransferase